MQFSFFRDTFASRKSFAADVAEKCSSRRSVVSLLMISETLSATSLWRTARLPGDLLSSADGALAVWAHVVGQSADDVADSVEWPSGSRLQRVGSCTMCWTPLSASGPDTDGLTVLPLLAASRTAHKEHHTVSEAVRSWFRPPLQGLHALSRSTDISKISLYRQRKIPSYTRKSAKTEEVECVRLTLSI